jgi:deoxyribodipyrimidine photolyase
MSEMAARPIWSSFLQRSASSVTPRSDDGAGTSSLSTYPQVGLIHPRQILHQLAVRPRRCFEASELAWRDFYADVLTARQTRLVALL